ncbi:hypothetical protein CEXT_164551 [Caerostris extrusa]|uniref:Uncharacterized protein n=1 Tax=Caerostris extrusa TaxID=172846 RepID=A0AAV4SLN2_CAEEX|nr:hypothetical protein CEXT_164551 [Caerostris extrusa]
MDLTVKTRRGGSSCNPPPTYVHTFYSPPPLDFYYPINHISSIRRFDALSEKDFRFRFLFRYHPTTPKHIHTICLYLTELKDKEKN